MVSSDTFLTTLYVSVDDFFQTQPAEAPTPGPRPSLSRSEVVTLAVFGQWARFRSERDFYRFADQCLRGAFPRLPDRRQFLRLQQRYAADLTRFSLHLAEQLRRSEEVFEVLDGSAVPTRNVRRFGSGWLAGQADIGYSPQRGWYEGFLLLLCVTPSGVITGFGFAPASTNERKLAETLLHQRHQPSPALPSVGRPGPGDYLADTGFEGREHHQRWQALYQARVTNSNRRNNRQPWPQALRQWLSHHRQIVETAIEKLQETFRLLRDRPHRVTGFAVRLAAKVALHNFCIGLNRLLGRQDLAFADLLGW